MIPRFQGENLVRNQALVAALAGGTGALACAARRVIVWPEKGGESVIRRQTAHRLRSILLGGGLAAAASGANAAPAPDPAVNVRAGVLFSDVRTRVRIDPAPDIDAREVGFERDLGLDRGPAILFVDGAYRFAPRWTLGLEYQQLDRRRTARLSRALEIGETVYPVDATVRGRFRSSLYKVQLGWTPIAGERAEMGVSIGAHVTDFLLSIAGEGQVGSAAAAPREERRTVLAPLPNAGLFGRLRLGRGFAARAEANYFQLTLDDVEGGLADLELAVEWQSRRRLGAGLGYRHLGYRLDLARPRFDGAVRYRFSGPILFVTAGF